MEIIVSQTNKLVKKVLKLRDKKYRYELGEYVVEGLRWINDAIKTSTMSDIVLQIIVKQCCFDTFVLPCGANASVSVVSDDIFDSLSETENSQGIMAILKIPSPSKTLESNYCLFLDRIRDPGNMGTIIRTACAAGYNDIVLHDCVDVYNSKVIRSCMTGILHINLISCINIQDIKELGYSIYAGVVDGCDVFELSAKPSKLCLVIGNEANGISDDILALCDYSVKIPMENIESLNASVSAGILMYLLKFGK